MTRHPVRVKPYRILFLIFSLLAVPSALSASTGITLPQANNGSVTLHGHAGRIITLAPNLTELVFAAGAGERLVAVVEYSNYPAQARQIPRIGDAFRIDLERIAAFAPDLVIAWPSGNPPAALQKLEQMGIRVWHVEINRLEEIPEVVKNISRAAGSETTGEAVASQMHLQLQALKHRNAGKATVDYFYQVAARPLYTINGHHIISRGLEICGGVNVFSGLSVLAPQVSVESVIATDPQAMIAPETPGESPALNAWLDWPRLRATRYNNFIYLPADEISQATPRLLDSIELACKRLDEVRERNTQTGES